MKFYKVILISLILGVLIIIKILNLSNNEKLFEFDGKTLVGNKSEFGVSPITFSENEEGIYTFYLWVNDIEKTVSVEIIAYNNKNDKDIVLPPTEFTINQNKKKSPNIIFEQQVKPLKSGKWTLQVLVEEQVFSEIKIIVE